MTRMLPKGKKGFFFLKNPVQASRERTVLTQYDREGFEIPCFQNSQLSVTTVQVRKNKKKKKTKKKKNNHNNNVREQKGKTNKCYRQVLLIPPPTLVKAILTEYHLRIASNRKNRTSLKCLLRSLNLLLT